MSFFFFHFPFFLKINFRIKSDPFTIKGQFTVQKAALEDHPNLQKNVKRGLEFKISLSFILSYFLAWYTSAEGLQCT